MVVNSIRKLYCKVSMMLSRWISWCYINFVRIAISKGRPITIDDITVLYTSNNYIAINKSEDIKVNSDDPKEKITVQNQLAKLFPDKVDEKAGHGFRFVHRLDYATSGALCVATSKAAARAGHKAFEKRYVTKHYLALVRGHVASHAVNGVVIDKAIGNDTRYTDVHRMCLEDEPYCEKPRPSKTSIYLMEYGTYNYKPVSKVLLVPHTGRTHQLRVHLQDFGHLIVGDYTYSNRRDVRPYRMMLHSYRLVIPMKYELIDITAPDPFLSSVDPLWKPQKLLQTYEQFLKNNPIHYGKTEKTTQKSKKKEIKFCDEKVV